MPSVVISVYLKTLIPLVIKLASVWKVQLVS